MGWGRECRPNREKAATFLSKVADKVKTIEEIEGWKVNLVG
jgi:hypothetical protein